MPTMRRVLLPIAVVLLLVSPALAQDGSLLTNLENEVVAAARGWETTILQAARSFRSAELFAGVVLLGLIGFVSNALLSWAEHRVLRWKQP